MKFDIQDPRITAYALGEELSEIDTKFIREIENDPDFQALVEDIQGAGNAFADLFAQESELAEPIEVGEILDKAEKPQNTSRKILRFPRFAPLFVTLSGSVAAIFAVVAILNMWNQPEPGEFTFEMGPLVHQEIPVSIPPELIEGTPQPIKVPNLEHITTAPRLVIETRGRPQAAPEREEPLASVGASSSGPQPVEFRAPPALPAAPPPQLKYNQQKTNDRKEQEVRPRQIEIKIDETNVSLSEIGAGLGSGGRRVGSVQAGSESKEGLAFTGSISADAAGPARGPVVLGLVHDMNAVVADPFASGSFDPFASEPFDREGYDRIEEKGFLSPTTEPLSTFSIDVDTASYANMRRFVQRGQIPPPDAVRIEEMINYFDYDYPRPEKAGEDIVPFSVNTDIMPAPWAPQNHLVRIGLQGYEIPWNERPASNLVFLLDVSGSMNRSNKLELVKCALTELIRKFGERDRIAIVTYAGSSGLALPSTTANNHATIEHALNNLRAGGSTNGGQGIELAYKVAQEHFVEGGNNRVILCTDGDFNVGISDRGQLTRLIEEKAKSGVFLSICGFGMGNYQDGAMEELSNKGNGNYAYIDSFKEAQKVFGKDLTGTLITIAKDVKIQVEFNPANVAAYRLIGYENRALANEDFNDDTKDAGEIGAGHSVTALYEIVPVGVETAEPLPTVDALKYQTVPVQPMAAVTPALSEELMTVKLRYKAPDEDTSKLISQVVTMEQIDQSVSDDFQFISAVAEFGLLLRGSELAPQANWKSLIERTKEVVSKNPGNERSEFLDLAKKAAVLDLER